MTKKRYVGLTDTGEMYYVGIEIKRTDWSPLAQKFQERLLEMVMVEDAGEKEIYNYVKEYRKHLREHPIEDFIFEKVIDTSKVLKVKSKLVKVWESLGYEVRVTEKEGKKNYQCIAPRNENLLGIKWIYSNGQPLGIPETAVMSEYKNKIDYHWYYEYQILPIAFRIAGSLDYTIGTKQTTLM